MSSDINVIVTSPGVFCGASGYDGELIEPNLPRDRDRIGPVLG
ncbi:hypothetical protein ACFLTS_03025 [Chloroflexota bacterium]